VIDCDDRKPVKKPGQGNIDELQYDWFCEQGRLASAATERQERRDEEIQARKEGWPFQANGSLSWTAANVPHERNLHGARYGRCQLSDICPPTEVPGAVRPARYIDESMTIGCGRRTEMQMQLAPE
jgi:hypothetical protein